MQQQSEQASRQVQAFRFVLHERAYLSQHGFDLLTAHTCAQHMPHVLLQKACVCKRACSDTYNEQESMQRITVRHMRINIMTWCCVVSGPQCCIERVLYGSRAQASKVTVCLVLHTHGML